jgi:hypothetical protein
MIDWRGLCHLMLHPDCVPGLVLSLLRTATRLPPQSGRGWLMRSTSVSSGRVTAAMAATGRNGRLGSAPPQRPELGRVAVGGGAGEQSLLDLAQLLRGEPRWTVRPVCPLERLDAALPPLLMPLAHALTGDLQTASDLGLRHLLSEQACGRAAPRLQRGTVSSRAAGRRAGTGSGAGLGSHASMGAQSPSVVSVLRESLLAFTNRASRDQ